MTPGRPTADNLPDWYAPHVAALTFPLGWKSGADVGPWRLRGRDGFRAQLFEDDTPLAADPQVIATEHRDGYRVERLELTLGRHRRAPALLAIPDGEGPFPAVLALHDHGAMFSLGKEKLIRPLAGHPLENLAQDWVTSNYGGRFLGDELARQGWLVLVTDAYGWGDRAVASYEAQQALASNLLGLGTSWASVLLVEDLAAARWLATRPEVDGQRLAAVGHSMGAVRAWQLHALSDQIRATVASCSFGTLAGLMVPGGNRVRGQSAFSMTHPGLARLMDFPDIAALGAPKPLLMIHGREDALFPVTVVQQAYDQVAEVYAAWGRREAFRGEFRPGGHVFSAMDQLYSEHWLRQVLKGSTTSPFLS